jgi:hypothetical protein
VYYELESKYKKSSKFEEVMVQNQKKMSDLKWNASTKLFPGKRPIIIIAHVPELGFKI